MNIDIMKRKSEKSLNRLNPCYLLVNILCVTGSYLLVGCGGGGGGSGGDNTEAWGEWA